MAKFNEDPLELFETARAKERERTTTTPFRFLIKDGERAIVRFLLDFDQVTKCILPYHERYNGEKYDVAAICASVLEQECEYCSQVKATKEYKLKPHNNVYFPVYIHQIQKMQEAKWVAVTYKDEGIEKPIVGMRMLEMKFKSSTILDDLKELYAESSEDPARRTITNSDFVISRRGSKLESKYSVRLAKSSIALPENFPKYTPDLVRTEVLAHYPPVTPGATPGAATDDDDMEF